MSSNYNDLYINIKKYIESCFEGSLYTPMFRGYFILTRHIIKSNWTVTGFSYRDLSREYWDGVIYISSTDFPELKNLTKRRIFVKKQDNAV